MKRHISIPGLVACAAAAGTLCATLGATAPAATAPAAAAPGDPIKLGVAKRVTAQPIGKTGKVRFEPRLRVVAGASPIEVWSTKTSHTAPITTEIRSAAGAATLPSGHQTKFDALHRFVRFEFRKGGKVVRNTFASPCLNSWESERTVPEADIRSPYPESCTVSRFTRGYVMGIQAGWSSTLELPTPRAALTPGTYQVTAMLTKPYADALGMSASQGRTTFTLVVPKKSPAKGATKKAPSRHDHASTPGHRPAASKPKADRAGEPTGPMPDLQSIPAWGIRINPGGNYLQFSATVWNAGSSPLVVDGFRRPNEAVMDAYQYFIDSDGNQTGYQKVGEMEWDNKDTHQHWHFRDFARYRLLDADKNAVVRSRKEAFCLANTDVIDYTVPGADWQPEGTDLHTSCGGKGSRSLREVLSSGSGDTYAQFRAGQSFSLVGLPNGVYYISVEANPVGRLVEQKTDNNVALRKVTIGGKKGARTVKISPIQD